jgi:hypothetical protein
VEKKEIKTSGFFGCLFGLWYKKRRMENVHMFLYNLKHNSFDRHSEPIVAPGIRPLDAVDGKNRRRFSRRLINLVPKKYSLPKDHFGREI